MSTTGEALRGPIPTAASEVPGPSVRQRYDRPVGDGRCEAYISGRPNALPLSPECPNRACWLGIVCGRFRGVSLKRVLGAITSATPSDGLTFRRLTW